MRTILSLVLVAALPLLLLSACGGGDQPGEGDLSGAVRVDGSSTVYPITEAVAEEFQREHRATRITVGLSGTGGGFSKFVRGETDVSNASRPIKASEIALAQQSNVPFIELPVAYDGIAVVVNPANDWVECLTVEELGRIWGPESAIDNWNQVRPEFPNRPIKLYGPGTDSGTYDYFTEVIGGESGASRSDFTASEDDNVLVQGIAGDPASLGYFGLAYYEENQGRLKLLGVDNSATGTGEGCIQPTPETVENGTYAPLSRPLFIYVRSDRAQQEPIRSFVEFYLESAGTLSPEVGYVSLPAEVYDLARDRFRRGVTGSIFESEEGTGLTLIDRLKMADTAAGADAGRDTPAGPAGTQADTLGQ